MIHYRVTTCFDNKALVLAATSRVVELGDFAWGYHSSLEG